MNQNVNEAGKMAEKDVAREQGKALTPTAREFQNAVASELQVPVSGGQIFRNCFGVVFGQRRA